MDYTIFKQAQEVTKVQFQVRIVHHKISLIK